MRKAIEFLGANLFLLGMLLVGVATTVALVKVARFAGADDETVYWLIYPIGLTAIAAMYFAGKAAHRTLSKVL